MIKSAVSLGVLLDSGQTRTAEPAKRLETKESVRSPQGWNAKEFAHEQIRGLIRQLFFSNAIRPARQVVFSALDAETEMLQLCRNVGEALARETAASVAVVGKWPRTVSDKSGEEFAEAKKGLMPLHRIGIRMTQNLWLVPGPANDSDYASSNSLNSYLGEVRREFEFSVIQAPPAGESDAMTAMGQFADGVVLVLSAERTRRVVARQVKNALEATRIRILGTVLSDRQFPIPEGIYRRL
jgi:hypothetical protein